MPEIRPEFGEFVAAQWTRTVLCRLLRDYLEVVRPVPGPVRVGTDLSFYYDPADRLARVTPDLYLVEGIGKDTWPAALDRARRSRSHRPRGSRLYHPVLKHSRCAAKLRALGLLFTAGLGNAGATTTGGPVRCATP